VQAETSFRHSVNTGTQTKVYIAGPTDRSSLDWHIHLLQSQGLDKIITLSIILALYFLILVLAIIGARPALMVALLIFSFFAVRVHVWDEEFVPLPGPPGVGWAV
jgi:hypothetical protein